MAVCSIEIEPSMSDVVARLFLITPPVVDAAVFKPLLEAAMGAADIACVLLRTQTTDEGTAKAIIKALGPTIQDAGAALLVAHDTRLAARIDADGVHIEKPDAVIDAVAALQPKKIVGVGALADRDEAMAAGEAGVDYVMFGGPADEDSSEDVLERVGWWAEIFNVPCVGYAHTPADVGPLARAGAEFVALCDGLWDDPSTLVATLEAAERALQPIAEAVR